MTSREFAQLAPPVITNQEGSYNTINRNDNGALSIGLLQWHGDRALSILKTICKNMSPISIKNILDDSLYNEIINPNTVWSKRVIDSNIEYDRLYRLLSTEVSKSIQLNSAIDTVEGYINIGSCNGIVDNQALIYFADIYNQAPVRSLNLLRNLVSSLQNQHKAVSLKDLHEAAMSDPILGKYSTRRNSVYQTASNTIVSYVVVNGKVIKYEDLNDKSVTIKSEPVKCSVNATIRDITNQYGTKIANISGYTGNSIVDALKFVGIDASFSSRSNLYKALGYEDTYIGSVRQNALMLNKLRK